MRREYAALTSSYERRWHRYLAETLGRSFAALAARPGERILDAGCGTGLLLARLAAKLPALRLAGVDASPEMLVRARERLPDGAMLVRADIQRLPFARECFDAVVATSVLHHFADPAPAIAEAERVLVPGGRLIVTDWNGDAFTMRAWARRLARRHPAPIRVHRTTDILRAFFAAGLVPGASTRYRVLPCWSLASLSAVKPGRTAAMT